MAIVPLVSNGEYPLLDVFWSMLFLFMWILWIFLLIRIISDVFRSHDLSGWGKAGWTILLIVLPFIGALSYLIVRGGSMQERDIAQAERTDAAVRAYVQSAAGTSTSAAEEISKLAALKDQGLLTEEEFAAQKAKLLG